jgi:hypothetical protein
MAQQETVGGVWCGAVGCRARTAPVEGEMEALVAVVVTCVAFLMLATEMYLGGARARRRR